jgi:peptide/nickel transport system permease protein
MDLTLSPEGAGLTRRQRLAAAVKTLASQPAAAVGTAVFIAFIVIALLGPLIAPYGSNEQIVTAARQPPSAAHWFGTDNLGRDVFSRVLLGTGSVFTLAGLGTLFAVAAGIIIGLFSGYTGGFVDESIMRFFDSLLSLPALLIALLFLGALGPSSSGVVIVIFIIYTPIVSRVVRSVVLSVKEKGFIEAARVQGESLPYILFRQIFPFTLPALAVEAALRFSYAIFLAASLGYLGVGVQPPSPDWGLMVREAQSYVSQAPWALYFPAGAIALIVISANLMADGLKEILQVPSFLST